MTEYEKMERDMKQYPREALGEFLPERCATIKKELKPLFIVPVKWEIYDETGEFFRGDMEGFDEDSITLNIKDAIIEPEELEYLAKIVKKIKKQYNEGL